MQQYAQSSLLYAKTKLCKQYKDMGYFNDFCNLGYEGNLGHPSSVINAFRQLQEKARKIELERRVVCKARYGTVCFLPNYLHIKIGWKFCVIIFQEFVRCSNLGKIFMSCSVCVCFSVCLYLRLC